MPPYNAVLVVEDDLSTQLLLSTLVRRHSLTPVVAGDGRTAIAEITARVFGAVLLDLLLPEENGFDVLRHIACTRAALLPRVIVVTAAADPVWQDCPYLGRIRILLRKPFDLRKLEREMLACCRNC
jgi:CheY-like chemotaxis protein